MLLAIDVGNTQTVVGMFGPGTAPGVELAPDHGLIHHWRVSTDPERTPDEYALVLRQLLELEGHRADEIVTGMAISSVVPRATAALRAMVERWYEVPAVVVGPGVRTGLAILYEDPKVAGADRVANAVGAHDLFGGPSIVVDFGTATTVDAVSAKGEFLGGAIVPGLEVSYEALFSRAAALHRVELSEPKRVIGRSTAESIRSGATFGYCAMVDGLCRRMLDDIGPATVVATGGLANSVAGVSTVIDHVEPWLTLHGLRLIYERNVA